MNPSDQNFTKNLLMIFSTRNVGKENLLREYTSFSDIKVWLLQQATKQVQSTKLGTIFFLVCQGWGVSFSAGGSTAFRAELNRAAILSQKKESHPTNPSRVIKIFRLGLYFCSRTSDVICEHRAVGPLQLHSNCLLESALELFLTHRHKWCQGALPC